MSDLSMGSAPSVTGADGSTGMAVVNERGEVLGSFTLAQVHRTSPSERATTSVRALLDTDAVLLEPDQPLDVAMEKPASDGMSGAAVVEGQRLVGQLHIRDVMETYSYRDGLA